MTISTRISVFLIVILQISAVSPAFAFDPVLIDSVEVTGGVTVSKETPPPFWMEANRDGRISRESGSSFFTRLRLLNHERMLLPTLYGPMGTLERPSG